MNQDMLYLVRLFYSDTDTNTIDARLDQDLLVFVSRDRERIEEDFG